MVRGGWWPASGPPAGRPAARTCLNSAYSASTSDDLSKAGAGCPSTHRNGDKSARGMPSHRYSRRVISGDPLTGRDSELEIIRRTLSGSGNHSGVVIAGAAGVGKTRLAREVLRRAEASGEHTKWIVGTESAHALPLGAFIGLLGGAMLDPLANVRRVIESFVAQQRRARMVLGVDDAHLLDGL